MFKKILLAFFLLSLPVIAKADITWIKRTPLKTTGTTTYLDNKNFQVRDPATIELPNSATIPTGQCTTAEHEGRVYIDTSAVSGAWLYICEGTAGWVAASGGGSLAGSDTEIQFNDGGVFGSSGTFTYTKGTDTLGVGKIVIDSEYILGGSGSNGVFGIYSSGGSGAHILNATTNGDDVIFNQDNDSLGTKRDVRFEGGTDDNTLFIDGSTDNVGIGTNTPGSKLSVVGEISGSTITVGGTTLYDDSTGPLIFVSTSGISGQFNLRVSTSTYGDTGAAQSVISMIGGSSPVINIYAGDGGPPLTIENNSVTIDDNTSLDFGSYIVSPDASVAYDSSNYELDISTNLGLSGGVKLNDLDASHYSQIKSSDVMTSNAVYVLPESTTSAIVGGFLEIEGLTGSQVDLKFGSLPAPGAGSSDDLGNHIATTTLDMAGFDIIGVSTLSVVAGRDNIYISTDVYIYGNTGIGTNAPEYALDVNGISSQFRRENNRAIVKIRREDTTIGSGQTLGSIQFTADDAVAAGTVVAEFSAESDGNYASGDNPTRFVFSLVPDGSGSISEVARITEAAALGINESSPGAQFHVRASTATTKGQIIEAAASQTANLTEWHDSSSTMLTAVDEDGNFYLTPGKKIIGERTSVPTESGDITWTGGGWEMNAGNWGSTGVTLSGQGTFQQNLPTMKFGAVSPVIDADTSSGSSLTLKANSQVKLDSGYGGGGGTISFKKAGTQTLGQDSTGAWEFTAYGATVIPMKIKGAAAQSANLLEIQDSASTVMVSVDASGYVGIGTHTPTANLEILTASSSDDLLKLEKTAGGSNKMISFYSGGSEISYFEMDASENFSWNYNKPFKFNNASTNGTWTFGNSTQSTAHLAVLSPNSGADRVGFRVTQNDADGDLAHFVGSGNVGIGTTSPGSLLDVNGDITSIGVSASTATFSSLLTLPSKTISEINALVPASVGEVVYCSNCSTDTICVSTATAVSSFARTSSRSTACQ